MKYFYFPEIGVVSMVSTMKDGSMVEVGTVGNEGFVGLPLVLGAQGYERKVFCQIPGYGWRIEVAAFLEELKVNLGLQEVTRRYALAFLDQIAQIAACNRVHTIEQRCARWLLTCHDRVKTDKVEITQEFLAEMLGVRRSGVNALTREFGRAGLIRQSRGEITITDRAGMEQVVCECYSTINNMFEKAMAQRETRNGKSLSTMEKSL
jgi:CRP-like cAMP-binding protein